VHMYVDRLEARRCFRGGVHVKSLVICQGIKKRKQRDGLYSKTAQGVHRLHAAAKGLGNQNIHVLVTSVEGYLLNKSNKGSERHHLRI